MVKQPEKRGKKRQPPHFPRLVRGQGAAGLEKLLWVPPTFQVRLRKTRRGTETRLIFTLPMPRELVKSYPGLHYLIGGPWSDTWENAITDGYWKSQYNNMKLPQFIHGVLRRAFRNGVKIYLEEEWNLPEAFYKKQVVQELSAFDERTLSKRGPQPNAQLAFWAAKRFRELVPAIRELRSRFKGRQHGRTQELKEEIEKLTSFDTYLAALSDLLPGAQIEPWTICTPELKPPVIARAIIRRELSKHGYRLDLKRGSLQKHIRLGQDLCELFAFES